MDLTYLYYQYRFQYYQFLVLKLKLFAAWDKLSNISKFFYAASLCFGSTFAGWLLIKFLQKRNLIVNKEIVDDFNDKRILSKRRQKGIPPGLFNEGNTCFTNCVMQALASCPSCYKWTFDVLAQYGYSDITLFPAINKLLKVLTNVTGNESGYSTEDVMSSLQSHGWVISREQQDAYEFFQVLISTMEEELFRITKLSPNSWFDLKTHNTPSDTIYNKVSKRLPVLMNKVLLSPFKGSFAVKMSCLTCGQQLPVKFEMFDSLILSLASMTPFSATLYGCLDEWLKPELLHEVECERCHIQFGAVYSTFLKQVSLAKLPPSLCIQLQRTTYTSLGTADKNKIYVQFPEVVDVRSYTYGNQLSKEKSMFKRSLKMSEVNCLPGGSKEFTDIDRSSAQILYKLNSVVVHYGGADGGHYITYRRLPINLNRWVYISDSIVRTASIENVLMSTAYLLFYEKVS